MSRNSIDDVVPFLDGNGIPFIGRRTELDELFNALTTLVSGKVQTFFVTGPAGVGKTRLVQEFVDRASRDGWQTWRAQADSIGGRVSFSSLVQALRTAASQLSSTDWHTLVKEFPYITMILPGFEEFKPQITGDVSVDRIQLFESLRLAVARLVHHRPTIIWFDDLPESDAETIDWLHYFIRHQEAVRIVFVATCRTPITNASPEYHQLYNALMRHGQMREIEVHPFNSSETELLVKSIVAGDVQDTALQLVQERTLGVPLFTVEMLRMLSENNDLYMRKGKWSIKANALHQVPRAITSVIFERIRHLEKREQELLNRIAVSDVPLNWTILQRSIQLQTEDLAYSLSYLIEIGILRETSPHTDLEYGFSHPMVQQVVYGRISTTALRQIHKVLAQAWQGNLLRSAHHIRQSGSMAVGEDAVRLLFEAGRHHLSNCVYHTAAEYLELAVELSGRSPDSAPGSLIQEAKLLLCQALAYTERVKEALGLLNELYLRASSIELKIRIKRLMARVESTRSVQSCIQHIEDGLRCWDGESENEHVFWMLNEQVMNYANAGDTVNAERTLALLRQYSESFPSVKNTLVLSIRQAHVSLYNWSKVHDIPIDTDKLFASAHRIGDPEWVYDAYCLVGYRVLNQGDYESAVRYCRECVPVVRRYGMITYEHSLRLMGMAALFQAGDWQQALSEAEAIEQMAREYSTELLLACVLDLKAVIYSLRGQWAKAQSCTKECSEILQRAFPKGFDANHEGTLTPARALQFWMQGDYASVPNSVSVVWSNVHGLPVFLKLLEGILQIRAGQLENVSGLLEQLRRAAGDQLNYSHGVRNFLEGLLANSGGNVNLALRLLEEGIHTFEWLDIPLERAMARLEWARVAAHEQPSQARTQAEQALTEFGELGAKPFISAAQELLRTMLRIGTIQKEEYKPQSDFNRVDVSSSDVKGTHLSDREREIAAYISQGLTTKQIADLLVLSPRTVTTHLDKMYRKLNVHSRTALIHKLNIVE